MLFIGNPLFLLMFLVGVLSFSAYATAEEETKMPNKSSSTTGAYATAEEETKMPNKSSSTTGDIIFEKVPLNLTVLRGQDIYLNWTFSKTPKVKLILHVQFHFKNQTFYRKEGVLWWRDEKKTAMSPLFPKLKAFGVNFYNGTLKISNIDYHDEGDYKSGVFYTLDHTIYRSSVSENTYVKVQGKPDFCYKKPSNVIKVKELKAFTIRIHICASPPAESLTYNFNETKETLTPKAGDISFTTYADIQLPQLKRDQCGHILSYSAKNILGKTKTNDTKIIVLYKPTIPSNLKAWHLQNYSVEVTWSKPKKGLCQQLYEVNFLNPVDKVVAIKRGYDIGGVRLNNTKHLRITGIKLVVSTYGGNVTVKFPIGADTSARSAGDGIKSYAPLIILSLFATGLLKRP